jgi:type II secretory pathway pseudopilin PulG
MSFFGIGSLIGGIIATGASLFDSRNAQKKQEKAQEAALELQRKEQNFRIQQLKKQAFERGRIVRAQSLAAQTNAGAGAPESSAIGGAFSVTSQANASIGNLNAQGFFQDATSDVNDIFADAARSAGRANTWGGVASIFGVGSQIGTAIDIANQKQGN